MTLFLLNRIKKNQTLLTLKKLSEKKKRYSYKTYNKIISMPLSLSLRLKNRKYKENYYKYLTRKKNIRSKINYTWNTKLNNRND